MASPAFQEWVDADAVDRVVLAEVQPAETLTNWTKAVSYADTILARTGLTGYWRLAEASGPTAVAEIGTDGTYAGTPTFGVPGLLADGSTAVTFAADDAATCATLPLDAAPGTGPWSIEFWMSYLRDAAGAKIFASIGATGSGLGCRIDSPNSNTTIRMVGGTGGSILGSATVLDGQPHQVGLTYDGTTLTLFVDGAPEGSVTPGFDISTPNIYVASIFGVAIPVGETIGQVSYYDRCLTADEFATSYALRLAEVGMGTTVYQRAWASVTQDDVVPGGVYRRLDSLRIDGDTLSPASTLRDLDAAPSGYCYDETTGLLSAKAVTGVTPDTFAAVLALFTIFVATAPIAFVDGYLYEPRIVGDVPAVTLAADDPLFGIKRYADGTLTLSNADRFFDRLVRTWVWKNKFITIKFGGASLAYADFETVTKLRVQDVTPNDDVCTLTLRAMATTLDKQLPLNTFSAVEYPTLGEGLDGTYKPLLYGAMTDIPGLLVDSTPGAQGYLVSDPAAHALTAVSAVRAKLRSTGALISLTPIIDYTVDLAACTVTVINPTYDATTYDLLIDATGAGDGAGGYLRTCGAIAKALLLTLGEDLANIDVASFDAADATEPADLALWLHEGQSAAEYMRLIEQSVLGAVFVGSRGLWVMSIWDPSYDPTAVPTLGESDMAAWTVDDKIESVFSTVRVRYATNPSTGDASSVTASDSAIQYAYETTDEVSIDTALLDASAATTLAQRYRLLAGTPTVNVSLTERGLSLFGAQPFDKVLVSRARAPHASGAYVDQAMECLTIKKVLAPPSVQLVLGELRGFGARIGRWTDDAAPAYLDATADDRATSGYWADDTGRVDPSDNATKDLSIWY